VTDGTVEGTRMLGDLHPGVYGSAPTGFVRLGDGRALFTAHTPAAGHELWITDGTAAGTRLVEEVKPGPTGVGIGRPVEVEEGRAVFTVWNGSQTHLYTTDGTAEGTFVLAGPAQHVNHVADGAAALGDGRFVFAAGDQTHGIELWISDGTVAGTRLLKEINPTEYWGSAANSYPHKFTPIGEGKVVFAADDGVHGTEPWITDGTAAGTVMLVELVPGAGHYGPREFTAVWGD
jgi:ELWxxDGT repeat protein